MEGHGCPRPVRGHSEADENLFRRPVFLIYLVYILNVCINIFSLMELVTNLRRTLEYKSTKHYTARNVFRLLKNRLLAFVSSVMTVH